MPEELSPLQTFWNVFAVLAQDVRRCIKVLEDGQVTDPNEIMFWDRALARSVFALIEGTAYSMAWLAYTYVNVYKEVTLSAVEIEELKNSYDFDEAKESNPELDRSRLLNKIQWTFDLFARVHKVDRFPLSELTEWAFMKEIFRNKQGLAHPRTAEELTVYEENRETLIEGTQWFIERVVDLLKECRDGMEAYDPDAATEGDTGGTDPSDLIM